MVSIQLASSSPFSQEPPKSGHNKTCWKRWGKNSKEDKTKDFKVSHQQRTLGWVIVKVSALQGSLIYSQLTFQIQHHPLSKRTEARVWVHLKREEALALDECIPWNWLRLGDPGTTCLSWSTATLDVTLAFKDGVHTQLPAWTLKC